VVKNPESVDHWGTWITTPFISRDLAKLKIRSRVSGSDLSLVTRIFNPYGEEVATDTARTLFGNEFEQNIPVADPVLWSPETPKLYVAVSEVYKEGQLMDKVKSRFGIREISYSAEHGFQLNGEVRKFKGVCLHHDLGPLGTAINESALRRQLLILKDIGVDAIRSAHNMPSLEQLELCDEMGFMFLAESFDEWAIPKVKNGYNRFFTTDVEKDIVNLVHATRNHPCIVMWSAGNEVPDQRSSDGVKRAKMIMDIFHREDPTRPVTVGMDQVENSMKTGFGAVLDVPGLNYRTHLYQEAYEKFPQGFLLGSETASTVSSRGIYKFPVEKAVMKKYGDGQSSSYDLEYCFWSNLPDDDFALQDDYPWVIGEFVWTGFDYLGEPTPYDTYWPSRSSYFGIVDLAGLPKDRFYLYRSRWNEEESTLHILPHWTWPGREGETTPVFVYTSYESAELFVNGKSQGIRSKNDSTLQNRYRLMWMDITYEPGTLRVVAYDKEGRQAEEAEVVTAGKPYQIILEPDRTEITADGKDLSFVTVSVVDKDGNPCPTATHQLEFRVTGEGIYRAACNGDPTSLEIFHLPTMKLFSGKLVVIVQSTNNPGSIQLSVKGKGLKKGRIKLESVLRYR
jgi:beta-galactosidase